MEEGLEIEALQRLKATYFSYSTVPSLHRLADFNKLKTNDCNKLKLKIVGLLLTLTFYFGNISPVFTKTMFLCKHI